MNKLYALTIPTGVGATQGGYAGDFGHIARKFAKHFDLIVNPNTVNGGIISAITPNMHYVEGWALDEFLCQRLELSPSSNNKIGVIFDCEIPQNILNIHINTINALKMVMGLDIIGWETTKEKVGVEFDLFNGTSFGSVKNPQTLIEAGEKLLKKGAQALGIVCFFPDCEDENYLNGIGADPIGGAEGIISHFVSSKLKVPSAHSPAFSGLDISYEIENPKVASEMISSTYLPCILMGLNQAPLLNSKNPLKKPDGLIVPSSTLGSKGVLGAIENNIDVYSVLNPTQINISADDLGIKITKHFESYEDCLHYLVEKNK